VECLGFDVDGGDADFVVLPERNCLPLPDEVSYVAGALMTDMLGSSIKVLGIRGGQTVGIVGLGPMGAAAVLVAKAFGAEVIAIDLLPARLTLASSLGADHTVDSGQTDALAAIRDLTGGRGISMSPSIAPDRRSGRTSRSMQPPNSDRSRSSVSPARPRSIPAIK
jgi:threonine dehydrogenase-like Zn-dependent dehydrogenase